MIERHTSASISDMAEFREYIRLVKYLFSCPDVVNFTIKVARL